jgi:hypothetical protein
MNGVWKISDCKTKSTSHNRSVYAAGAVAPLGYEKPQSAYGLCAVFLRHIASRRNATHCFMGGLQRHIQPERYVKLIFEKIHKNAPHPCGAKEKIVDNNNI